MKTKILEYFQKIPYFTIEAFRQVSGTGSPEQTRMLLYRWAKAGKIISLKKGVYMTKQFYDQHKNDVLFSASVSAILFPQSYLSLEYVLQGHNILTEATYPVTCITTKNTRKIENRIGLFWYRNIKQSLYKGFSFSEYFGVRFAVASLAKALFDYFYLRPIASVHRSFDVDLADELRLNLDDVNETVRKEFTIYVKESNTEKMKEILENLKEHVWRH